MFTSRLSRGLYFQSRFYVKALKRRVVRILSVEESEEFHQNRYTDTQQHRKNALDSDNGSFSTQGRGKSRASAIAAIGSNNSYTSLHTFEKLLSGDRRFGPVVTEAKLEYGRQKNGLILLEGKRLLLEAVQTNQKLKTVFFTNSEVLSGLPIEALIANGVAFYQVATKHMKVWSDTVASQGIMAVCKLPCTSEAKSSSENLVPITLICDGIQDAGSLGTLIRSAAAARCCSVLVTEGCVDVWEPKVLRASAGAHFHAQSLVTKVQWNMIKNYLTSSTAVYVVARQRPVGNRAYASTMVREKHSVESLSARNSTGKHVPVDLPTVTVDALSVKNSNVAIIVSDSLSSEARQFVIEANGYWIQFPSHDIIDVFNLPVAGSVALFETIRHISVSGDCTN